MSKKNVKKFKSKAGSYEKTTNGNDVVQSIKLDTDGMKLEAYFNSKGIRRIKASKDNSDVIINYTTNTLSMNGVEAKFTVEQVTDSFCDPVKIVPYINSIIDDIDNADVI